jgi:hypothetical protein
MCLILNDYRDRAFESLDLTPLDFGWLLGGSHHLIVNQLRQTGYHNNTDYSAFNILTCIRLDL